MSSSGRAERFLKTLAEELRHDEKIKQKNNT